MTPLMANQSRCAWAQYRAPFTGARMTREEAADLVEAIEVHAKYAALMARMEYDGSAPPGQFAIVKVNLEVAREDLIARLVRVHTGGKAP